MTADVVHQRCIFEPFALAVRQSMHGACLVEERKRQANDLIGMLGVIAAPLCELERASPTDIRDAVDLRDLSTVAPDVIEHQSLTEREVAERQFLGAEPPKDRVEQNRTGDDEIRASRIESGDREALLELQLGDLLSNFADLLDRDVQVAQLCRHGAACRRRRDCPDAEDRAGGANDAVEPSRKDLLTVTVDFGEYMVDDLPLIPFGERVAADEAFGQPNRSDLEAARQLQGAGRAQRNLHAAAADVDDHGASAADINAIHRGLMNETRLFDSRNDARTDTGFAFKTCQEFAAVSSLARSAGRGRQNLINLVRLGDPLELRQRLQRRTHCIRSERTAVKTTCTQPDHRFLAVNHLEGEIGSYTDHDHVN